jgi:hypothetical protein
MPIETLDLTESKFENYLKSFTQQNWTLCVGAGICKGILPDWYNLTHSLVNKCFNKTWTAVEFEKASKEVGFSLDSWIQGCANKMISNGKTIEEFNKILEQELYEPLLLEADKENLRNDIIQIFESPKKIKKKALYKICDFFERKYSHTTLIQLINTLLNNPEDYKLPNSIITFNADSLLHSLLVIFNIKIESDRTGIYHCPTEPFRKVTRSYQHWADCIPIFHLHGSLSPHLETTKETISDTRDSLIFLESSYSQVASSMHSWAQSNFLYLAQNSKMVFLGLSMSDPNIRKWMAWANQLYIDELNQLKGERTMSLSHLWIKTKSSNDDIQEFMDVSLRHLGVKIGLIENWGEVENTLLKIM